MTVTYYTHSPGRLSDGTRFHASALSAASRVLPLRSRWLLTSRGGRRVIVVIRDRTAPGRRNLDLTPGAMRLLAGPRYRVIGVLRGVHVRRVK